MAGKANKGNKRLKDYGKVLMAKQLLKAIYNNPRERVFKRFFGKKMEALTNTNQNKVSNLLSEPVTPVPTINKVFTSLSSRLEIILTAMGGALSHQHARQLINHGKVSVNGFTVKQRNYLLKDGDIIVSKAGLNYSAPIGLTERTDLEKTHSLSKSNLVIRNPKRDTDREARQALFQLEKKVGGMKTVKLPKYLKIKTPVAASLLINPELSLGIYYSKALFTQKSKNSAINSICLVATPKEGLVKPKSSASVVGSTRSLPGGSVQGWKNMNVKELKLLLAPASLTELASGRSKSSVNISKGEVPSVQNADTAYGSIHAHKSIGSEQGNLIPKRTAIGTSSLIKEEQVKWETLYSLVQAYYLRK